MKQRKTKGILFDVFSLFLLFQFAIAKFSDTDKFKLEYDFNTFPPFGWEEKIDEIPYVMGQTYTGAAIKSLM